ncbi:carbohydrate ABC transporter permease [Demequina sp. NBRC 110056]|uniref:carbohydrate ABC transporter permease n=1 Tax=Demequina sp. NBRC 110056 TaxID=1570345 RepID=UPI001F2BF839|nr:carbohydrate ABC transporter permease [Demequina sp. NBRC 110056]
MTTSTHPDALATRRDASPAPDGATGGKAAGLMPVAAWWIVGVCLAVLFLYPIYVMASQITWDNIVQLSTETSSGLSIIQGMKNSAIVAFVATGTTVVVATLAGYAFAKLPFKGSNVAFFAILVTFMIPFQAIITPLYLTLNDIGLSNNLVGVGLVLATFNLPLGTFLMRNSFAAVPSALSEAAEIDGASPIGAMWRVMLPIAIPGVISTTLLTFFSAWNDFFAALILITDQAKYTLPVSISILQAEGGGFSVDFGLMQTGVAITVIPCIILYLVLQKYYVAGLLGGALK